MFITLEGPEGSGKTSVMREVIARLKKRRSSHYGNTRAWRY